VVFYSVHALIFAEEATMRTSFLIAVIATACISFPTTYTSAQTVNIQVFQDETQWETAVKAANANANILTENFQATTLQPGVTQSGGIVDNGVLKMSALAAVFKMQPPHPLHELNFNPLITAMGGTWDTSPGGAGRGIEFDLVFHLGGGTQQQAIFTPIQFDPITQTFKPFKGFFGIVADQPFQSVIFWSSDSVANEQFTLDDLKFVQSSQRAITVGDYKFLINPKLLIKH
jgi:hypothetical protein